MDILLFSNGKANKEQTLLEYGKEDLFRQIEENNIKNYLLIPYAVIRDTYEARVADLQKTINNAGLSVKVNSISDFSDPVKAVEECDAVVILGT